MLSNNKYILFCLLILLNGCNATVPDKYEDLNLYPSIYPDYTGITIPCNIAPINFLIKEEGDSFITHIYGEDESGIIVKGKKINIDINEWNKLLSENAGKKFIIDIYVKNGEKWEKYSSIQNYIAVDSIDEYISYRLIEPGYFSFEDISIRQRNLTSFDESDIYNNSIVRDKNNSQCINCHSYQNYRTNNMQFHGRLAYGGTMLVVDGIPRKVNLKTDQLISGGVYPAWHPTEKLIAYSVNHTSQSFHSRDPQRVEVQDTLSDLILYDIESNEVSFIQNDPDCFEVFPAWSPDGKTLYYVSALFDSKGKDKSTEMLKRYEDVKYNIFKISFDIETKQFGVPDTVFNAQAIEKSATLPRISPDGRYLLFALGNYGIFHVWHKSSDLHIIDLETGEERKVENINSNEAESYHSWSSNGRWIIFGSRRDDGLYTRPYLTYFDRNGTASKPFIVPQKDPEHYYKLYKSFNIPEFMVEPVRISVQDFAKAFKKDAINAEFRE